MGRFDKMKAEMFPKYRNYAWRYDDNSYLSAVQKNQKIRDSKIHNDKDSMLQHCADTRQKYMDDTCIAFDKK